MTLKEKLELKIIELGTKEFFEDRNPELIRSLSHNQTINYVESKFERIVKGLDKVIRVFTANLALIEFLIWIKNNMFSSSGKFTFKILKIFALINQVRLLINRIVNPDELNPKIEDQ